LAAASADVSDTRGVPPGQGGLVVSDPIRRAGRTGGTTRAPG